MPRLRLVVFALLVAACSDPSEPNPETDSFKALLSGNPQIYVLSLVENQRTDPIITFDHQCAGVHRQTLVRDTIELRADGSARRAIYMEHRTDGQVDGSSYIPALGTWTSTSASLQTGARVTLQLSQASGSYSMPLRVAGRDRLSIPSALGGTCSGSALDARTAEFVYVNK